jgi:hypothetical protein
MMNINKLVAVGFVLMSQSVLAKSGGVDGGGGSIVRLLSRAGAHGIELENPLRTSPMRMTAYRGDVIRYGEAFIKELEAMVAQGRTEFWDAQGAAAKVGPGDIAKLRTVLEKLKKERNERIKITSNVKSFESGEDVSAVNLPGADVLYVSAEAMSALLVHQGGSEIGAALIGHELASLIGIENEANYAVSANMISGLVLKPEFECEMKANDSRSGKKITYKVRVVQNEREITVTPMSFDWSEKFGKSILHFSNLSTSLQFVDVPPFATLKLKGKSAGETSPSLPAIEFASRFPDGKGIWMNVHVRERLAQGISEAYGEDYTYPTFYCENAR